MLIDKKPDYVVKIPIFRTLSESAFDRLSNHFLE
jgi:hypothetical protein